MPTFAFDPKKEHRIPDLIESPTDSRKPVIYWDTGRGAPEFGFGLMVRKPQRGRAFSATWVAQFGSKRVSVGKYGEITLPEARKRAVQLREAMEAGIDPIAARKRERATNTATEDVLGFTVGDTVAMYLDHLRQHATPATVKSAECDFEVHLSGWYARPLAELTRTDTRALHSKITADSGPRAANKALKHLRTAWTNARSTLTDLPVNIIRGTKEDRGFSYNLETEGGDAIAPKDLPEWFRKVESLSNPVRRSIQLFCIHTGLRAGDCLTLRWKECVDLEAGTVHLPNAKGRKPFTMPVSAFVLDLLKEREEQNALLFEDDDGGWVFPTSSVPGLRVTNMRGMVESHYVAVPGQKRKAKRKYLPSPHVLRRTFATACVAVGISDSIRHILLNHAQKQDMAGRYVQPDDDMLRDAVEKVARYFLKLRDG